MCPFPIYPLYTRTVILSLDKPIADCFLFRPRKSRERRRKRSHTNVSNASVTRTSRVSQTPLQTPIPYFHQWVPHGKKALVAIACKTAHVRFHRRKWVYLKESHTAAYTPKQVPSGQGRYHYPRRIPHVHEHPRAGCQNGKLCRFWVLVWCSLEEHRKPSEQRCAYARRCSEASQPRWAAQLYLFIGVFTFVKDLAGCCQYSSPITKGAADSNIRIGTLSGHDQNTPRRSKIQQLNAMRQHIRVLQCMALRLSG